MKEAFYFYSIARIYMAMVFFLYRIVSLAQSVFFIQQHVDVAIFVGESKEHFQIFVKCFHIHTTITSS